ncbi:hypothetical protein [Piscibacillus salipiscarius]|uniref:hypothetical protein n=1 Tax=Piscibacillus salipiscarius TaxID=299480 RepID=UPI0006CFFCDA|nr:hypothetical protein [Piscibacillus salipiscarius]
MTIFDTQKSFNQIKDELIAGAGDVEVIEEEEDYFSYQSKNKESIKTEVYLKQNGQQTLVLSFLANKNQFDELSDTIKEFQSAVKLKN